MDWFNIVRVDNNNFLELFEISQSVLQSFIFLYGPQKWNFLFSKSNLQACFIRTIIYIFHYFVWPIKLKLYAPCPFNSDTCYHFLCLISATTLIFLWKLSFGFSRYNDLFSNEFWLVQEIKISVVIDFWSYSPNTIG